MITTENEARQTEVRGVAGPTDQLRATLDSLLDPHVLVRPVRDSQGRPRDFVCFEANEAAMAHLGRAREDVVGARLADLLPATLHADLRERLVVTLETGQPLVLEDHAAAPDPLEPERRFDLRVIRIGHALSCTWSDVTQRHEIEASLRRRVTELDVMHRISQALAVRTDLGEALDLARREVARLFRASSAAVCLLPEVEEDGALVASCRAGDLGDEVPPDAGVLVAAALARQAAIEGRCTGDEPSRVLAAPMITRGRAVGVLTIARDGEGAAFRPRDITVAQSIADSLAAAVENERLHRRERRQAATDERQRLARELHDSATQTIYSANLIAEVLPASWERGREEGRHDTRRLGQLMRTALCEMRTLLYELRPETLEAASLEF